MITNRRGLWRHQNMWCTTPLQASRSRWRCLTTSLRKPLTRSQSKGGLLQAPRRKRKRSNTLLLRHSNWPRRRSIREKKLRQLQLCGSDKRGTGWGKSSWLTKALMYRREGRYRQHQNLTFRWVNSIILVHIVRVLHLRDPQKGHLLSNKKLRSHRQKDGLDKARIQISNHPRKRPSHPTRRKAQDSGTNGLGKRNLKMRLKRKLLRKNRALKA